MAAYYDLYKNPPREGDTEEVLHARILPSGTLDAATFRELVHKSTGLSPAILEGVIQAVTDELHHWLSGGWTVEVGELGHFSVSLKCDKTVTDGKDIRSPSIRFKDVNLRISNTFRKRFNTMKLERKPSPYIFHGEIDDEANRKCLMEYLDKNGCITRAVYESLSKRSRKQAIADLNRYVGEGWLRRYGRGRTVVYLPGDTSLPASLGQE